MFFIDAVVILITLPSLGLMLRRQAAGAPTQGIALSYAAMMVAWWTLRALLRWRAGRLAPVGTLSLLPSALWPWRYLGTARSGACEGAVVLFTLNGLTGAIQDRRELTPRDEAWRDVLERLPELEIMRELSPAFHVTEVTSSEGGTRLRLRDLRVRNFASRWGEVEVLVTPERTIAEVEHHV